MAVLILESAKGPRPPSQRSVDRRGIAGHAAALSDTGLRCVFAESVRDTENVRGPMAPERYALSEEPRFSPRLREEGMQRIHDLHSEWHGAEGGRISVFPAAALTETSSPELLRAIRDFAEANDLGYTIHLNQSRAEFEFMVCWPGRGPTTGAWPPPPRRWGWI